MIKSKFIAGNIQIIIAVSIVMILTGIGIGYFWQESRKNEIQEQQQLAELTREPETFIRVVSPNGGEKLCLGENTVIKWESSGFKKVIVEIGSCLVS